MGQTSLISLILQPPLPMSEPHWLAGTTRRMVTGGLLVAVLLVIEVLMSWRDDYTRGKLKYVQKMWLVLPLLVWLRTRWANLTSSSFSMIMEKALKMEVVGPARVMILSGQFPSEMLMRAPLCTEVEGNKTGSTKLVTPLTYDGCVTVTRIMDIRPLKKSIIMQPTSSLIFLTDSPFCKDAQPQIKLINKPWGMLQWEKKLPFFIFIMTIKPLTLPIMLPTSCKGEANTS